MNEQMHAHDLNYDAYYLEHHGIKGQKWGVRRFQNPDGTLTNAGKKHKTGGLGDAYIKSFDKADKRLDQRIENNQHEKKRAQKLTRSISDGNRLKNAYLNAFDSTDKRLKERKANNQYEKKRAEKLVNTFRKNKTGSGIVSENKIDPRKEMDKFKKKMKDPKKQAATAAATLATISVAQSIQNARVAEELMGVKLAKNQVARKTAVQAGKVAAAAALSVIGAHMIHDYMKDKNASKQKK